MDSGREFGIGRLSTDTDPVDEAMAALRIAEREAADLQRRGATVETCPVCGQTVLSAHMMGGNFGRVCPNCYDDTADGDW